MGDGQEVGAGVFVDVGGGDDLWCAEDGLGAGAGGCGEDWGWLKGAVAVAEEDGEALVVGGRRGD